MGAFAPGLAYYPYLETDIVRCQAVYGKKVLVLMGGEGSALALAGDEEARRVAGVLWELFGPVGEVEGRLRPFGGVVVDGFDLDLNTSPGVLTKRERRGRRRINKRDEKVKRVDTNTGYWGTLASALRERFATDKTREYYLSAAPGCSQPERMEAWLVQSNFVWPRKPPLSLSLSLSLFFFFFFFLFLPPQ